MNYADQISNKERKEIFLEEIKIYLKNPISKSQAKKEIYYTVSEIVQKKYHLKVSLPTFYKYLAQIKETKRTRKKLSHFVLPTPCSYNDFVCFMLTKPSIGPLIAETLNNATIDMDYYCIAFGSMLICFYNRTKSTSKRDKTTKNSLQTSNMPQKSITRRELIDFITAELKRRNIDLK